MTKRSVESLQTLFGKAVAAHQAGQIAQAERLYTKLLQANPEQFDVLRLLGHLELSRGRAEAASKLFTRALRVDPASAEVLANRGTARLELGLPNQAVDDFAKALAMQPGNAGWHNNHGTSLARLARQEEALAAFDRALALRPDFAQALYNRGNVLLDLERYEEAIADFNSALTLQPDYAEAAHNRGVGLRSMGKLEAALASFEQALALRPGYAEALKSKGGVLRELGRHDAAAAIFAELLQVDPLYPHARGAALYSKLASGDWSTLESDLAAIRWGIGKQRPVSEPGVLVTCLDDPSLQLQCARLWVADMYPTTPAPLWRGERYGHAKIRIAYVSADFGDHPVAHLMAEVFERHDRTRFQIVGISLQETAAGEMRARLMRAFDDFVEAQRLSEVDLARLLRGREIDIAIDLMGFTQGNRMGLFAHRPAPVQVNYLGYPGSTGAPFIDYILADRTVIPEELAPAYSEYVVRLPKSFLANGSRPIASVTPGRTELGLPETGFVFCSFNRSIKILPQVWSIWMRLLRAVDGSVLWLASASPSVTSNLRQAAASAGIDPNRLVFATKLARIEDHLARFRRADLFLDTFPYNGHTTSSDALLAGLPVLTCLGRSFAARVAGSLLQAAGIPELVTPSLDAYEALAAELARDPKRLAAIRERLAQSVAKDAQHDCARFTRALEDAYVRMWERSERGAAPAAFDL